MARTNLYDFEDLVFCAEKIGYDWNTANNILVNDEIPPMYETKTRDFCKSETTLENNPNNYEYSDDTCKILQAFFEQEEIDEFTIV